MKKVLLIVLIVLVAIIAAVIIFVAVNKDKLVELGTLKAIEALGPVVAQSAPEGIEADSVVVAFQNAVAAIRAGEVDSEKKKDLLLTLQSCMADEKADSADVVLIMQKLKALQAAPAE